MIICSLFITQSASAISITYTATNLPDSTVGDDLWQYTYLVEDNEFAVDNGFSILFDHTKYSQLENPAPTVNADWDILTLEPDPLLPDDGVYDALSLVNSPSLSDVFSLNFIWSGVGTPESQPFELFDDSFAIITTGNTALESGVVSNVPLPATILLFGSGFGLLMFRRAKKYTNTLTQKICS